MIALIQTNVYCQRLYVKDQYVLFVPSLKLFLVVISLVKSLNKLVRLWFL